MRGGVGHRRCGGAGPCVAWVVWRFYDAGQLEGRRWSVIWDSRQYLWGGLLITLRLAAVAIVLATALGLVLALGRTAERAWIRWPVGAWVELFRAIPLLALIIFAYIALPKYDIRFSPFWCVVAGLRPLQLGRHRRDLQGRHPHARPRSARGRRQPRPALLAA